MRGNHVRAILGYIAMLLGIVGALLLLAMVVGDRGGATRVVWLIAGLLLGGLWAFRARLPVFRIADNRGAGVARSILGTDREKVVISDRFPSYDWIEQHQYCWSHLRRDFQAMIDRGDEGSAIGSELLGSSDRLFHWWHKYRDGEMAWSTFLGYARPIRWGVRQALERGTV